MKKRKAKKAGKVKSVTTYAPVWTDTNEFHLHPTCDRRSVKPPDTTCVWSGRQLTYIRVRIVPIPPKQKGKR